MCVRHIVSLYLGITIIVEPYVLVGCGLGGACNHIKAYSPSPFPPHQRKICSEGIILLGLYSLGMLGENTGPTL